MTHNETISECRAIARKSGLTFKKQNAYINGEQAYQFCDRKTGLQVASNFSLGSAYNNCLSGYIESYDIDTRMFEGI